jgi:hypothetical protein
MPGNSKTHEPNESVTFRLKPGIIKGLRRESEHKGVTLNTLVTQVLSHHLDWDANAAKAGFIPVPRYLMKFLLSSISDEKVAEAGASVARNQTEDALLIMRGGVSADSLMTQLKLWLREAGMPSTMTNSGSTLTWVIQHDMGARWSMFLAKSFEEAYYRLSQRRIGSDYTENTVVFTIETG